jgi:hypothetical protein
MYYYEVGPSQRREAGELDDSEKDLGALEEQLMKDLGDNNIESIKSNIPVHRYHIYAIVLQYTQILLLAAYPQHDNM